MEVREDKHEKYAPGEPHRGLFGDWEGAPITEQMPVVPVPLSNLCEQCGSYFLVHPATRVLSTGILVPRIDSVGLELTPAYYHRVCWLKMFTQLEEV